MSGLEGWTGKSVKDHVTSAQGAADEAMQVAADTRDELEVVSQTVEENHNFAGSFRYDLDALKAEFGNIEPLFKRRPGMIVTMYQAKLMTHDSIAEQAEMLGALAYEALGDWCLKSVGDEAAQRNYVEDIGFGLRGFLQSIAMQIRGSLPPEGEGE